MLKKGRLAISAILFLLFEGFIVLLKNVVVFAIGAGGTYVGLCLL